MNRLLAIFALLLPLALVTGCEKKEEAKPAAVELTAPTDLADDAGWKAYLNQEINKNQAGVTDRIFPYYLPSGSDVMTEEDKAADGRTKYARMVETVTNVVQRTVLPGNMLVFASPDSAKMADLVVASFTGADPEALKGSKVLFIGNAADNDRVKVAVEAAGANYVFVEAK
jgi:hypothetical protein